MRRWALIVAMLAVGRMTMAAALFDQPPWWGGNGTNIGSGWTSHDTLSGTGYRASDSFSIPQGGAINQVSWSGIYLDSSNHDAPIDTTSWTLNLNSDNAGVPGSVLSSTTIPESAVTAKSIGNGTFAGNTVTLYDFTASLPSFSAAPGATYWFSPLSNASNSLPSFVWTQGIQGVGANNASYQTALTNGAVTGTYFPSGDRAFSLANTADLPMTGTSVPALQSVDTLLQNFMRDKAIPGGTVAITHAGKTIYERGIGYSDAARTQPMQENALMRLASVTKPVTASAIQQLIKDSNLSLSSKVFNIGGNGGILNITPYNGVLGDSRLKDITVNELLQHEGGWNRDTAGDLAFKDVQIANAEGLASPPGIMNTARYILSQPLQFTPGTTSNYSNIGYMFLGMVVEAVSGQPYENYVDNKVLAQAGIPNWEITQGHTFAADKNPREPYYSVPYSPVQNVYDPNGPLVPWPYGGWDQEKQIAYGGQIGSAKAVATLAETRIAAGPEIGKLRSDYTTYPSYWWYHTGSLEGTDTLMLEASWKDWTYSILFDRRPTDGSSYTESLVTPMQNILEGLTSWPAALIYSGDFTNDQWLRLDDVTLFKQALARGSQAAFNTAFPSDRYLAGDFDGNGLVNEADSAGFIAALKHAGVPDSYVALVPDLPGDFNRDGKVDMADYVVWRDDLGDTMDLPNETLSPGVVDLSDYDTWRSHFGESLASGTQLANVIPESSTLALVLVALVFGLPTRCRRRSSTTDFSECA